MDISIGCPASARPDAGVLRQARRLASGAGSIEVTADPVKAARGAQALYTDVWVSMGQEGGAEHLRSLKPFQLNAELLGHAAEGALVMHCLPAHRGEEITGEVMDGEQSVVWDQAENRMYAQMALLDLLI